MINQTLNRPSTRSRAVLLAVVVMVMMGLALAAPARLRAEGDATTAGEMRVFDWNKPVTVNYSGFAQYKPLSSFPQFPNGNWVSPINYNNGTLYIRARVISIPKNQPSMKLGFCFWQQKPKYGEECTKNYALPGFAGSEGRWSQSFGSMAKINGAAINWTQPRWKAGFVVRGPRGPVSNKLNFNWSGENPANWYPMNIHYTIVLVAPGGAAPDWTKYGWPTR